MDNSSSHLSDPLDEGDGAVPRLPLDDDGGFNRSQLPQQGPVAVPVLVDSDRSSHDLPMSPVIGVSFNADEDSQDSPTSSLFTSPETRADFVRTSCSSASSLSRSTSLPAVVSNPLCRSASFAESKTSGGSFDFACEGLTGSSPLLQKLTRSRSNLCRDQPRRSLRRRRRTVFSDRTSTSVSPSVFRSPSQHPRESRRVTASQIRDMRARRRRRGRRDLRRRLVNELRPRHRYSLGLILEKSHSEPALDMFNSERDESEEDSLSMVSEAESAGSMLERFDEEDSESSFFADESSRSDFEVGEDSKREEDDEGNPILDSSELGPIQNSDSVEGSLDAKRFIVESGC